MSSLPSAPRRSVVSAVITNGKDLVALLRDASLFLLAALLIVWPTTFNSMLVQAGFEEGSFVGFKWKSKLVESNTALHEAQVTITDLRKTNEELANALADANIKLADPVFRDRVLALEKSNGQSNAAAQIVQSSVDKTIRSNVPFVEKARQSSGARQTTPSREPFDFLVGLQTFGVPDATREDLNARLRSAGYGLHETSSSYQPGERPSWLAARSTVLYYDASALATANEVARLLKGWTGQEFVVQKGSGRGVDPGQRDITLFVHYVKA